MDNPPTFSTSAQKTPPTTRKSRSKGCFFGFSAGCFTSLVLLFLLPTLLVWKCITQGIPYIDTFSQEELFEADEAKQEGKTVVARLELQGVITGEWECPWYIDSKSDAAVLRQIESLIDNKSVDGILLVINSPGGSVTASDNLYHALERFKLAKEGRKIFVMGRDVIASGAYYLAMQADWIRVQPTSVVGSIGVIIPGVNLSGLAQRFGVEDNSIASGASKDLSNPLKPINPEHNAVLKTVVDGMYERFIGLVAQGRKLPLHEVRRLADGRVYTADDARIVRLIDDIGYEDTYAAKLAEMFGCTKDKLYIRNIAAEQQRILAILKNLPDAIGRGVANALAKPDAQPPQYRW